MFLKFLKSKENQLKIVFPAILILSILLLLFYADNELKKRSINEFAQKLYQQGKAYESEINSEFKQYTSISELLALSISKNIDSKTQHSDIKSIFKYLMSNHKRLTSVAFLSKNRTQSSTASELLSFSDSLKFEQISFVRAQTGIFIESTKFEFEHFLTKIEVEKVVPKEQTRVLSPVIKRIDNQDIPVVPVVSSVYKGNKLLGYVILDFSIDWLLAEENLDKRIEAYVSSANGRLIVVKENNIFLSDNLVDVCFACDELIKEKGTAYNTSFEKDYLNLCFPINLENSLEPWYICLRGHKSTFSEYGSGRIFLWLLGGFILILGVITVYFLTKRVASPWEGIKGIINGILSGEVDAKKLDTEVDDPKLKDISILLVKLSESLNEISAINESVISGDYSKKFSIPEFKNNIIKSSKLLHQQLKSTNEDLEANKIEAKQAKLYNEGLDKIARVLKLHHEDLVELSENVIKELVDLMEITMGAMFLAIDEDNDIYLEQTVSYAYHENKYKKRRFKLGDSLVGACAAEKRTIHLKNIPEDYLKVISGLGQTSPKGLLIIPLVFENKVLGVIELGTLSEFDNNLINFAESAAENIASTLSLVENNIRTTKLLEENRLQTKELEERDRMMKEALSELKTLQSKTAKSEAAVRAKLEAMNNTLMIVEYTTEGVLLDANYKFLNTMNYTLDEIKGNNVIELLKEEDREELLKIIKTVKNGNFYESLVRRHTKHGQEKWFLASYTPVFNDEGVVQNILFFGIDITRMHLNENQLKVKIDELSVELRKLKED